MWLLAAAVLLIAGVVLTVAVNVPLNDAIKAAGDPDRIPDLAAVRTRSTNPVGPHGTSCAR